MYADMDEYISRVVVPEMLIKLKQSFGRLIRTEWDSGAVAILDCRAALNGAYRDCMLEALPDCEVTDDIAIMRSHFELVKPPEYFYDAAS